MKQVAKFTLIGMVGLSLLSLVLGFYDLKRLKEEKLPLFTFTDVSYDDGGTRAFAGFGFCLVFWHRMSVDTTTDGKAKMVYLVGPELRWGPSMFRGLSDCPQDKLSVYPFNASDIPYPN